MTKITIHSGCYATSKEAGVTKAQYDSAMHAVDLALKGEESVDCLVVKSTKTHNHFRSWVRVKAPKSSVRAFVMVGEEEVIVYAVLPRNDDTYEEATRLWLKLRTRK